MKKKITITVIAILGLGFAAAALVPIGSYETTNGCPSNPMPTQRVSLLHGGSIEEIRNGDVQPGPIEGCSVNTRFILYVL